LYPGRAVTTVADNGEYSVREKENALLTVLSAALLIFAAFILFQIIVVAYEFRDRHARFRRAQEHARAKGKPLLVVGRPGNNRIKVYTCGDVTIDLDPGVLKDCPRGGCVADVRSIPYPDGYFGAAFVSFVLDYLPSVHEFERALAELHRVADNVVICYTLPLNIRWRFFGRKERLWISKKNGQFHARLRPW